MRHAAARMPDGQLCMLCLEEAAATYGTCPGCHTTDSFPDWIRAPGSVYVVTAQE